MPDQSGKNQYFCESKGVIQSIFCKDCKPMPLVKPTPRSLTVWLGLLLGLGVAVLPLAAIAGGEFRPPTRGIPGRREGAGTRDVCIRSSGVGNPNVFYALVPAQPEDGFGLTTAANPRFFWYMPRTRAKFVEFALFERDVQNPDGKLKYKTNIPIGGNNRGIVSWSLPQGVNVPALEVGKDYRWTLTPLCPGEQLGEIPDPQRPLKLFARNDLGTVGWISRVPVDATLQGQLQTAKTGSDRAQIYAQHGLWFDTLASMAEERCTRPRDAATLASWKQLMQDKSVKLEAVANQPLLNCKK
jgi:hypothetical protein